MITGNETLARRMAGILAGVGLMLGLLFPAGCQPAAALRQPVPSRAPTSPTSG